VPDLVSICVSKRFRRLNSDRAQSSAAMTRPAASIRTTPEPHRSSGVKAPSTRSPELLLSNLAAFNPCATWGDDSVQETDVLAAERWLIGTSPDRIETRGATVLQKHGMYHVMITESAKHLVETLGTVEMREHEFFQ
jgi:hypothetical protein